MKFKHLGRLAPNQPELTTENAEHYKQALIEAAYLAKKMNMPVFSSMLLRTAGEGKNAEKKIVQDKQ